MFRVWSPRRGIAISPLADFTPFSKHPTNIGGSLVGVWNGWGYGIAIFRALNFQISEPEIWQKSLCGILGIFPKNSASEKYFSDSGKWPFHTPPIHTPTKCRSPNNSPEALIRSVIFPVAMVLIRIVVF